MSIVIAVYNGGPDLERCLAGVAALDYTRMECILVDDASTDGVAAKLAGLYDLQLISLDRQSGPAHARNVGGMHARGDILFFTDADVVLHPQALTEATAGFASAENIAAVFGSYDTEPGDPALVSQYRNLLHHWVHQSGQEEAFTFWSGCGAVKKSVFQELGGFDTSFDVPSIEDIELGGRIRNAGHAIRLQKSMQGTHLKQWRFWNMVKTDIFCRAVPWMGLLFGRGEFKSDLNLDTGSKLGTAAAGLMAVMMTDLLLLGQGTAVLPVLATLTFSTLVGFTSAPTGHRHPGGRTWMGLPLLPAVMTYSIYPNPWALGPVLLLVVLVMARRGFYEFLSAQRNATFALATIPLQCIFFLGCAIAIPLALGKFVWIHKLSSRAHVKSG